MKLKAVETEDRVLGFFRWGGGGGCRCVVTNPPSHPQRHSLEAIKKKVPDECASSLDLQSIYISQDCVPVPVFSCILELH